MKMREGERQKLFSRVPRILYGEHTPDPAGEFKSMALITKPWKYTKSCWDGFAELVLAMLHADPAWRPTAEAARAFRYFERSIRAYVVHISTVAVVHP